MGIQKTSKFISLILRHKPEVIGIALDEHGWADVQELIEGVSRTHPLSMGILEEVVYEVMAKQMEENGHIFYRSVNGVWLTKAAPAEYLRKISPIFS